jgi:6-pyruvoyltetrahydropterin/6-carboxytetrahydropterin synthase
MYILTAEHSFDSAHFLSHYEGKCSNIHGHRWRVVVEIQSETLIQEGNFEGMVMDFSDIKKDIKALVDELDHALIIQKDSLRDVTKQCLLEDGFKIIEVDFRPTAEHLAAYFYQQMENKGYDMKRVTVYETPNNSAIYEK